ncbi:hypothetical protein HGG70_07030 [Rhodobacteraceae bacterium R_SAG4]|nr:hypothetical protein [Rhodobacteraceae bacterium R_SAG4]
MSLPQTQQSFQSCLVDHNEALTYVADLADNITAQVELGSADLFFIEEKNNPTLLILTSSGEAIKLPVAMLSRAS